VRRELYEDILDSATKQIRDFERYRKDVEDENARRKRRSLNPPPLLEVVRPSRWDASPAFNPYMVRKRHAAIAHAMTKKLKGGTYIPHRPASFSVPKPSGGERQVNTYAIADEVVSRRLYKSLMRKNAAKLNAHSFAYRNDRTPHDAISYIHNDIKGEQRLFVAEFDFSKFFDLISHDYLWETFADLGITASPMEESLIRTFLAHPPSSPEELDGGRRKGLPQGTSISLFLANVAATPIDRSLERLGVGFARYADDTLIWSDSYEKICTASHILQRAAHEIGSPINFEKSPGIRILSKPEVQSSEIEETKSVNYLGHTLGLNSIRMRTTAVERIKKRVQTLIYTNLLMEPLRNNQNLSAITSNDRDYVTYIWQLRRYLYGPLSENEVRRFQHGAVPAMSFQGVMSFFPLVDHDKDLIELDVWIATQTWLALKKRAQLLSTRVARVPRTWDLNRSQLIQLKVVSGTTGDEIDLRLPSLRRIAGVIRLAVSTHGFESVSDGSRLYLYESD
jgi:RNA-directed DNA polymerase